MATIRRGEVKIIKQIFISLPNQLGSLWNFKFKLLGYHVIYPTYTGFPFCSLTVLKNPLEPIYLYNFLWISIGPKYLLGLAKVSLSQQTEYSVFVFATTCPLLFASLTENNTLNTVDKKTIIINNLLLISVPNNS